MSLKSIPIYLSHLVILLLSTQVVDFVAFDNIHVIVFLAPLFYWAVHRPAMMPLWFVFLGGVAVDFAVDSLLGLHAFVFVVYTLLILKVRRIILSQPFMYHVMIYALSALGFEVMRWVLISVLSWDMMAILPSLLSIVLNIVVFVPLWLVLKLLHRVMSGYGGYQSL